MTTTLAITPVDPRELAERIRGWMSELLDHAGLAGAVPTSTENRSWTPMDHTYPPDCPFIDATVLEASAEGREVSVRVERAHWNPDDVARTSVDLFVKTPEGHFMLSGAAEGNGGRVTELSVAGDLPDRVAALVAPLLS